MLKSKDKTLNKQVSLQITKMRDPKTEENWKDNASLIS